jgi:predicted GNAT family N-acyltransferase
MSKQAMGETSSPQTLARFRPSALQSNGIICRDETPASAKELVERGQLHSKDFIEESPDIENTLMEAFIEDDYDGRLHLMTLSMMRRDADGGDEHEIIGLSFWREVPVDEMRDWFDLNRISKMIANAAIEHKHDDDFAKKRMKHIRTSSVNWIKNALMSIEANQDDESINNSITTQASIRQQLTHAWVKIELIAIKQNYRDHHLGNILLGCTLSKAHDLYNNDHAILHVAGGGASKNVPAAKLYSRFGFVPVPNHEEGGPFVKPDKDLFVLGNIGKTLVDLPLETLQIK